MVTLRNFLRLLNCGLLVLAVSFLVALQAQRPLPFSADIAISSNGQNITGKMYFALPKTRMDMTSNGRNISVISDNSTQTSYMIQHQQRMYFEMHGNQPNPMARNIPKFDSSFDPQNSCVKDGTCKKAGTETVNGRVCDKWVTTQKDGKTSTAWLDQRLFVPIKTLNSDGNTMELSNIKEGAPPASTFEVPAGYRKMDLGNMGRPQN
jgi:uncharacterized protein DUF4412